eukprot:gene11420-12610_t
MSGLLRSIARTPNLKKSINLVVQRSIYVSTCNFDKAPAANSSSMDPVQKLFLDKIKDYQTKAKKLGGGKLVDLSPEHEKEMQKEVDGLKRRFGEGNLEEFPKFDFGNK